MGAKMSKFTGKMSERLRYIDSIHDTSHPFLEAADLLDEAEKALAAMMQHSCVSDTDPEDKSDEDHLAERLAHATLARIRGEKA